jgi:hypothetical protein
VVIPKGFPKSVERVGSRLHGFPPFPYSVISTTCFSLGTAGSSIGFSMSALSSMHSLKTCTLPKTKIPAHWRKRRAIRTGYLAS